jgi:hypothetical protein
MNCTYFTRLNLIAALVSLTGLAAATSAQVAIKGTTVYTMSEAGTIRNGVVVITDGKVSAVGKAGEVKIPDGYKVIEGAVVVPGLIDSRGTVGVSGMLNQKQDQDQIEHSSPVQPELRAIDAFNNNDPLVAWVRSLGITTVHTGHAPGELISGQTCVVKTDGRPIDQSVILDTAAIASTIGPWAQKSGSAAPGTRAKMVAMLREELIKAREYAAKGGQVPSPGDAEKSGGDKTPTRSLHTEALVRVLKREVPLMISANNAQDISSALRLAKEFDIRIILDSAAEAYLLINEIKAAGVPVFIHPTMTRMFGEMQNSSMETCAKLVKAGIPVAIESGFEDYVPKSRVVLFEAAIAAANGCSFEEALATITTTPAKILGIDKRVGHLAPGLDGDVAVYDGDPFEYTTHCTGVVINGVVVSNTPK